MIGDGEMAVEQPRRPRRYWRYGPHNLRMGFRAWRRSRPFWGGLWAILGGAIIALGPASAMKLLIAAGTTVWMGILVGVVISILGLFLWFSPSQRHLVGVLITVLAVVSLITSDFGGFLIGMLLAMTGGSMGFSWVTVEPKVKLSRKQRRAARAEARAARAAAAGAAVPAPVAGPAAPALGAVELVAAAAAPGPDGDVARLGIAAATPEPAGDVARLGVAAATPEPAGDVAKLGVAAATPEPAGEVAKLGVAAATPEPAGDVARLGVAAATPEPAGDVAGPGTAAPAEPDGRAAEPAASVLRPPEPAGGTTEVPGGGVEKSGIEVERLRERTESGTPAPPSAGGGEGGERRTG